MLALLACVWLFDEQAFRLCNGWYNGSRPVNGELHQIILSLAMFGQMLGIGTSLVLVALLDRERRDRLLLLALVLATVGVASNAAKMAIGRARPLHSHGATIIRGPTLNPGESRHQAFPSGHTATAFAMACTLSRFYPRLSVMVWPLAVGVGFNRVVTLAHYPTDIIAGAWLGMTLANAVLGWSGLGRRVDRWSQAACLSRGGNGFWHDSRDWFVERVLRIRESPLLLATVCLLLYWTGNGETPLFDRDEPRFATATREMLARGDWIVPTFNGELRPDKPILVYWLMGTAYRLFGDGPFAARFFSGLAGMLACLTTYHLGRRMFDRRVGLVAGWMLALAPMIAIEAKLATADALLLACLTGAMACAWPLLEGARSRCAAFGFWLLLSLGVLAKGPVALAVIGVTFLAFVLIHRDTGWLARLRWTWGLVLAPALVLPWTLAVNRATDGAFLAEALGRHVLARATHALENHRGFSGYYVVAVALLMAPWVWLFPWAVREHVGRMRSDRRLALLAAWIVGPFMMFELVRTKLVHYYLPAYPALALFIAAALVGRFEGAAFGLERLTPWAGRLVGWAGGILGLAAIAFCLIFLPASLAIPGVIAALVLTVGFVAGGWLLRHRRFEPAFVVLVALTATGMIVGSARFLPPFSQGRLSVAVAARLREQPPTQPVALWQYRDPSVVLSVGRPLPIVDAMLSEPAFVESRALATRRGAFLCPMTPTHLAQMRTDPMLHTEISETIHRWDPTRLSTRTVHLVLVRPASAALATRDR